MAEPFYQQPANDVLYLLQFDGTTVATAAYLPSAAAPTSIPLTASWESVPGVYLFFDEPVADQAAFLAQVQVYLGSEANAGVRCLWISAPDLPANHWGISQLKVANNVSFSIALFDFNSYLLSIGGGCAITLDNNGDDYWLTLTQPAGLLNCYFQAQDGAVSYPISAGPVQLLFRQGQEGSWVFPLPLGGGSGNPAFETLDAGCRYYIDDPAFPGTLLSLRYPLFVTPAAAVMLQAGLDPVHPLDGTRSFLNFLPAAGVYPVLASFFRTNLGELLTLTPTTGAGLVFAAMSRHARSSPADGYTLVPRGAFTIGVPANAGAPTEPAGPTDLAGGGNATPVTRILPGVSGVEYLGLTAAAGYRLWFFPGCAAYAPSFQPAATAEDGVPPTGNEGLLSSATTSWVYLTPPAGANVLYYAQPESSVLYQPGRTGPLADYLDYAETPAGELLPATGFAGSYWAGRDPTDIVVPTAFPAVPYAGIAGDDNSTFKLFEQQILSPSRRKAIAGFLQPPQTGTSGDTGDDVLVATPQGLLVELDATRTHWRSLTLAHAGEGPIPGRGGQLIRFANITGRFQTALTSNQLFLVAADPEEFLSWCSAIFMIRRISLVNLASPAGGNVPAAVLCSIQQDPGMVGTLYTNKDLFDAALKARLTQQDFDQYKTAFYRYCGAEGLAIEAEEFYRLSDAGLTAINSCGAGWTIPAAVVTQIRSAQPAVLGTYFPGWPEYSAAMGTAIGSASWTAYGDVLSEFGHVTSGGWRFDLSPYNWTEKSDYPTLFLFKYAGKSIVDLAADVSTWSWVEAAKKPGGQVADTQKRLLAILDDAIRRAPLEKDFRYIADIVTDPGWNGILVLNANLSLSEMPAELQGLAAGIDPAAFYGHHLGIAITPIANDNGTLKLRHSSLFGLIYYEDAVDQYNEGSDYAFKALSLKVRFENSVVAGFSSQIELLMNALFGERSIRLDQTHGNNIILDGIYQKHDGHSSYVFSRTGSELFGMLSHVMENVEITQAQFVTVVPPDGFRPDGTVQTLFLLNGRLRFKALPGFDCFSFGTAFNDQDEPVTDGYLHFSNLVIHMSFPQGQGSAKQFSFDAGNVALDASLSRARSDSFYAHFPLQLSALVQSVGTQTPGDLGFMATVTPLNQGSLKENWYGFTYSLDLGSLGSLSGDTGFFVTLFIGWSSAKENYNIYIGTALPGSSSSAPEIPIEGLLKMAFRKIEIAVDGTDSKSAYMLKFRGIALSLFGLKFPSGAIDAYIAGNPGTERGALGWYAAYAKKETEAMK